LFSRGLALFLELCSNLYDLPANGIKAIQDFTIYLTFSLDSFLEVHVSVPIPLVERISAVSHIPQFGDANTSLAGDVVSPAGDVDVSAGGCASLKEMIHL
jgi:hypothetical protein